jgi:4-amino-4-deoxy-L-arabinose transferase-like glycosyltransferase
MLLLIVSFLIFIATALQLNRYFKYQRIFDWGLGLFLIFFSLVVFVMTILGLFYRMNNPWFVLVFQVLLLLLSVFITRFWKTPSNPVTPFKLPRISFKDVELPLPVLIFLLVTVGVGLLNLIYVLFVPPNNNDSLAIHLARIGMWDQLGSWLPWNTKVVWQLTFPFNAEMFSYWTLLFTRGEHLLGLITYLAGYISIFVIYQLAKEFTQKRGIALLAALTWAAFPVVQLNFTSTRHDHPSSLLVLAAVYFFYQHLKAKNISYLVLAGLAIGLSIGTNYSVAGYLPCLALMFLLYWLVFKQVTFKEIITLGVSSLLAFLIFSSAVYISNYVHFSSFLGPEALEMTSQASSLEDTSKLEHVGLMAGRWAYQIVDFQGIPEPYLGKLMQIKAAIPEKVAESTGLSLEKNKSQLNQHIFQYEEHIPFSEDSSWFGLVGVFVFFVVSIYVLVVTYKTKQPLMVMTSLFLITTPVAYSFLRSGWTPYDGRYFITLFAMLCLGLAVLLNNLPKVFSSILIYAITILSITTLLLSIYQNPAKSFWGYKAFWKIHRFDSISAQAYDTKEMIYLVDQTVPEDGVLGIATTETIYYEYGLFGENFTRKIIPINPDERICDPAWLDEQGVEYLLVDYGVDGYPACSMGAYQDLKSMKNWIVFER